MDWQSPSRNLNALASRVHLSRFGLRKEFSYMETLFADDEDDDLGGGDEPGEQYL